MIAKPKAQLLLHLDENIFLLGGKVTGEVEILPHESFEAEEIRIELECYYFAGAKVFAPYRGGDDAAYSVKYTIKGPLSFANGSNQSYTFALDLPEEGVPSYHRYSVVRDRNLVWWVRAVVSVKDRLDLVSDRVAFTALRKSNYEAELSQKTECKQFGALFPKSSPTCPVCGTLRTQATR